MDPLFLKLGSLPRARGEGSRFREAIEEALREFTKLQVFQQIVVPVELELRVTREGLRLGKDLDNIMLEEVIPCFSRHLGKGGKVIGYSALVADPLTRDLPGDVWLRVMPAGSIGAMNNWIERMLENSISW
jgi:hypothetical protein